MAYQKINFQNEPSTLTPVSAENLNHMEDGIAEAHDLVASAQADIDNLNERNLAPVPVSLASEMTEQGVNYLYLGSEDGYDNGYLYYINAQGVLTRGNEYQAVELITDPTLSGEGQAADAKAAGDAITSVRSALTNIVDTGSVEAYSEYVSLTRGQIKSDGTITTTTQKIAYVLWSDIPDYEYLVFDDTTYKVNLAGFDSDDNLLLYTAWATSSPQKMYKDYAKLGINITRQDSAALSNDEILTMLKLSKTNHNLATVSEMDEKMQKSKSVKCIYPDGFTSRIKPNIYFDGYYFADIDTDDYKVSGYDERWVATDGSDSNNGLENAPFLTIDKAITVGATTIHLKEGNYSQGTHYSTTLDLVGRNLIGHGTVVLNHDNSDHYVKATGSCYVENVTFKFGTTITAYGPFIQYANASGVTACFVDCAFIGGQNAFTLRGADAVMVRCKASGAVLDGFNYHARTVSNVTYIPNVIEIDCKGYDNGSALSGSDSCNGSTAHDGTKIIRVNGEYYNCYGGVIAEIGVANDETTVSVNYGVLSHESIGSSTYKASFWVGTNAKMYLYDCKSYGGDYDLSAVYTGLIVSRRLTTGRDVPSVNVASTATVYQY